MCGPKNWASSYLTRLLNVLILIILAVYYGLFIHSFILRIYLVPVQETYSEAISALAHMMLSVITNDNITSLRKTMLTYVGFCHLVSI